MDLIQLEKFEVEHEPCTEKSEGMRGSFAHKSMHYGLTVYGEAVHEEEARRANSE